MIFYVLDYGHNKLGIWLPSYETFQDYPHETIRNTMVYTLGTAAKAVGMSKATIHRALKAGTISAVRKENGTYEIQPAELHRVYPPVSLNVPVTGDMRQSGTGSETPNVSLEVANARLEAEVHGLNEILRLHKEQVEDLRTERDRLMSQVEATTRLLTHHVKPTTKWRWLDWRSKP